MTTLREAAQQALEALENCRIEYDYHGNPMDEENAALIKAADALRAALAEPVQEPVAWMHTNGVGNVYFRKKPQDKVFNPQPLYTAPPQRKPLTEGEIGIICASLGFAQISPVEVARAIERAHNIT